MGLEDDARRINEGREAEQERASKEAAAREQPVTTPESVELARIIQQAGHKPEYLYELVANKKWARSGAGWRIYRQMKDNHNRTGYTSDLIFVLKTDGTMWALVSFMQKRSIFDGLGRRGGSVASSPYQFLDYPVGSHASLMAEIAAVALRTPVDPKGSGSLSIGAD